MPIQLSDLLKLQDKSFGQIYVLNDKEKANLQVLAEKVKKYSELLKPFLISSMQDFKLLLFDVETDSSNRDDVRLVGVLSYPNLEIYHYDHALTKVELDSLVEDASVVVFVAFNYGFDLIRAFSKDARDILLRRFTRFGDQKVSYYIYRKERVISYALDVMRLSSNLLDEKKRSLKSQSETNMFFKKLETEDFLNRKYNAYDLLSCFELLSRCLEKAAMFLEVLGFEKANFVDFVLKQNRYEVIESHISPIKLFESGARIAKILVAPYTKFPSFPAFYAGGRVKAWQVGRFRNFAFYDVNSEYPSIMSKFSPRSMRLCYGEEARNVINQLLELIKKVGPVEAFSRLYVNQEMPVLALSSWVLVQFLEDSTWKIEVLKEKQKKSRKLLCYTLVYRNRREEQTRAEALVNFKAGMVVNFPLYFLFLQSKNQLKRVQILDACGFLYTKDEEWSKKWSEFYAMRRANQELATSLKIALNAVTGLLCDVDQAFSNLALAAHVTAFARTISWLIESQLKDSLIYHDTDSYVCSAKDEALLKRLLNKLAPWGAKKEYADAVELVVFRTKRYAVKLPSGEWIIKGAERSGFGREKNRIQSFLLNSERQPIHDIRQVTKQENTPNIPAVRKLLKNAESGEWCFYFSYPLSISARIKKIEREWYLEIKALVDDLESGGWGESLRLNRFVKQLAIWCGFNKQPSKKLSTSQWFLEFFEHLRAYGYETKEAIFNLIRNKKGCDLSVVEAQILSSMHEEQTNAEMMQTIEDFEDVVYEITKSGRVYFASKLKEPLEDLAGKLWPLSPANLKFEKSSLEKGISAKVFAPLLGKPDTTFLEAQISQAGLLHIPLEINEKMRLLARVIGKLGHSDNYGVKLAVNTLDVKKKELIEHEPTLWKLPRKARKRSPFAQRRFYVIQRFPYKVRYHISWDAVSWTQVKRRKFVFRELPLWLPSTLIRIIECFFNDVALLEAELNEALKLVVEESDNILFKWLYNQKIELKVIPYARYCRFDVAYDIPPSEIKQRIEEFEEVCEQNEYDYRKGLGFIGINGRVLSDSRYFVSGNIVLYDRNRRFNLKRHEFLRRFRPFVEAWQNEPVGRLEIQCFAHRSNNRKANPLAALLNVLELYKIQAPKLFEFIKSLLSVITNMLRDPHEGSGAHGANSENLNENCFVLFKSEVFFGVLSGLGVGPP
ncbi:MAG: hypothetical protein QXN36_01600 [Candidatus Bathyarchaeia archaeon]